MPLLQRSHCGHTESFQVARAVYNCINHTLRGIIIKERLQAFANAMSIFFPCVCMPS